MLRSFPAAAAAAVSASLFGCGPGTPTPAPYAPMTVSAAWDNHFSAFGAQDVPMIMKDYDAESVLQIYNDGCMPGVMMEFVGVEPITQFFTDLFATLTPTPDLNVPNFTSMGGNPTVEDNTHEMSAQHHDAIESANVFLVWSSVAQGIEKATDTFTWKEVGGAVKVKKQNIVATQTCPDMPGTTPAAPEYDAMNAVAMGWANHLAGFGDQNKTKILADYMEESVVQIWTWGMAEGEGYETYTGLEAIGGMFDALWASMNAQKDDQDSIGLNIAAEFPRVEVDKQTVFLVWWSYSNPKATDTFLFDDHGMILRQTIVTTAGGMAPMPMINRKVVV